MQHPLNDALSWMQATGVLQKMLKEGYFAAYRWTGLSVSRAFSNNENKPIVTQNMILVYIILSIGIFLCISAFAAEITIRRFRKAERGNVVQFIQ